jgi:transcriptional regulator with XRE-family HTH domain
MAHQRDIMPTPHLPTMAVVRALRRLGGDLRTARSKRRLPMRIVAERAGISRATLQRVERGDPGVGAGIHASVLHALGLLADLDAVAHPLYDEIGQAHSDAATPRRARLPRAGPS